MQVRNGCRIRTASSSSPWSLSHPHLKREAAGTERSCRSIAPLLRRSAIDIPRLESLKRSYDLAKRMVSSDREPFMEGRYVTTILKDSSYGIMRTLDWTGTTDNNEQLPNKIYFMKIAVGGATEVKKVTVLR